MAKNLFKCGDCSYVWAGKPIKARSHVHTNKSNQSTLRCPSCHNWSGLFVSEDVPSSLLAKKSIATRESREAGVVKEPAEKDFDSYLRLLEKTKSAESLKHSIRQLSSSSDDFDKLLKVVLLKNAQGGGGDIEGLRRDINDIKIAIASMKSNPGSNPGTSAGEVLLRRVIESVPLNQPAPANPFGINSLDDLRQASQLFVSKGGRNLLDLEVEKIQAEFAARREERNESARWHNKLLEVLERWPEIAGRGVGKEFVEGYERDREKRKIASAKPISVPWRPVPGNNTNLVEIDCPTPKCGGKITFERGVAHVVCPRCNDYFTFLPEVEHEEKSSRSPASGSSPSRASAQPGVESQASGDYVTGSVKESAVVVGGRVREGDPRNIVLAGDTKKTKREVKNGTS